MTAAGRKAEARCKAIWEMLYRRPMGFSEILSEIRQRLPFSVSEGTLSTYLKWLADRYLVYQLPSSGPGTGGPPYAAQSPGGALREHLRDLNAELDAGLRAWRRETGQPEPEEPTGRRLEDLPRATEIPLGEPGRTMGDYMEWEKGKRIGLREDWVRIVSAELW